VSDGDPSIARFHAVCAPGLEAVTVAEIAALGGAEIASTRGGVGFSGPLALGFRANLWLRTAVEVRLRLARFHAPSERLLAERAREVAWRSFLRAGEGVEVRVSVSRSRLAHTGRIAELVAAAAGASPAAVAPGAQRLHARLVNDTATLSIDMSGELLHRRGYRQETGPAPLRETIAAALLLALDWNGTTPLIDPLCGSGTIPIEAALIALRIAPGLRRSFACERWPASERATWEGLRAEAAALVLPALPAPIAGSDRNAGAVGVAQRNAERAQVAAHVALERRFLADAAPPPGVGPGLLLANPPYGRRVREVADLGPLYAEIGRVVAARFGGWRAAVVNADPALDVHLGLPRQQEIPFLHGGLRCRLIELAVAAAPRSV